MMRLCDYIKKRSAESAKQAENMQVLESENKLLKEQVEDTETATKILLGEEQ
nr:MAG TPA: hypothetical protein [Caudoviricetes sp.]